MRASLALLVGPTALAIGLAVGLALQPTPAPQDLRAAEPVTSAPVTLQQFDDARQPGVRFTVDPDVTITTTRTGRVTQTHCRVGESLDSGQVLIRADDQPVVALATSIPLYRDLTKGSKGNDVSALQAELERLGLGAQVTGVFDADTVAAVKALQKTMGIAKPTGKLALADIAWLPTASLTPTSCDAVVGDELTSKVATAAGALRRVSFDPPAGSAPGDRQLRLFGAEVLLPGDADGTDDPTFLAAVSATREYAAQRRDADVEPTADWVLAEPIDAWKVPPAALFGLSGQSACVQVDDEAVPVTIVGSGLGASLVQTPRSLDRVRVGAGLTLTECEVQA